MENVNYDEKIKSIVLKHLPQGKYEVFLFGSRATGNNKKWSDYDIGVLPKGTETFPASLKYDILDELDKQEIPFFVDLVDFRSVDETFKEFAYKDRRLWTN